MLRYCAWCGVFQGATPHPGYQIRRNVCEIDTSTICPSCLSKHLPPKREQPTNPILWRFEPKEG